MKHGVLEESGILCCTISLLMGLHWNAHAHWILYMSKISGWLTIISPFCCWGVASGQTEHVVNAQGYDALLWVVMCAREYGDFILLLLSPKGKAQDSNWSLKSLKFVILRGVKSVFEK